MLHERAGVRTPAPIGVGVFRIDDGAILLLEDLHGVRSGQRGVEDWPAIGRTLASIHSVHDDCFGSDSGDGFFGPFAQDDRPVASNRWADFYAERRLEPRFRAAFDSGHLPSAVANGVERVIARMEHLSGPEPRPTLLHGDAQQHNFVATSEGIAVIDVCPFFGHPEIDLALVDYFDPVPDAVFDGYRDVRDIDAGFAERRELWRVFAYLAVITVTGHTPFGRRFVDRLDTAVRLYA